MSKEVGLKKTDKIDMGPVGFEPTTASAPGKYLNEIISNQLRWYPWPS